MDHGGRRAGAGRKSRTTVGPAELRKTLRLTQAEKDEFEQLVRPGETWSDMVRRVLRQAAHIERLRRSREQSG